MAQSNPKLKEIREFIYVAQPPDRPVYAVKTIYQETDAINAVGHVCYFLQKPGGIVRCETALNTNDGLDNLWCSPEGNLWVGSTDGHVWTTAEVDWEMSKVPEIVCQQTDPHFRWKCSEAIRTPRETTYSFAATWGSSDRDVFMGTFQGAILRWNGAQWGVSYCESAKSVQRMHGTGPENIWAVGRNGLVLHFDGNRWRTVPIPGGAEDGENLTGVWALSAEEVHICSSSGALFHGSHNGLERLGEYPYRFYGIVEFDGELYLAAGDHGVCVLRGNVIEQVKKTFSTSGIYRLPTRIAFVEPNQLEKPRVVIHDPTDPKPWSGWSA